MNNLEQLARIIQAESTWSAVMSDGYTSVGRNSPEHIAQALINAGWTAPVTSIDIEQRVDEILANDDIETRHIYEDALYEELAVARLTAEERVHIQRLQDADLVRWYA